MAIDLKEYFASLAKDGGWDDATQQTVLKAIADNEKVSKKLGDELMTRPDYSRSMDELRKQTEAFEQQKTAWQEWYKTADSAVRQQQAEAVQAKAALNAYKETFGDLTGGTVDPKNGNGTAPAFDPAQLQTQMTQQFQALQQQLLGTVVETAKVQGDYFQTFNRPMSPAEVDELTKLATSQGRPLSDVYREYVAPKLQEKQKAEWEAETTRRTNEAVKDALSKHQIPVDAAPKGTSSFLSKVQESQKTATNPRTESERRASFVEAWNSGAATGVSK